ncbi:hypothetical protein LCGC14_0356850 [marine sediment metagenome]|uniref:Uncharacterized protein n=1 Tax=marine sediment metagenome TaxID=412755 RepID=A0A0F9VW68_9ZZZZ
MKYLLAFLLLCGSVFGQISPSLLDGETNSIAIVNDTERRLHAGKLFTYSVTQLLDDIAVKQVAHLTPGGTVDDGDIFTIIIEDASVVVVVDGEANIAEIVDTMVTDCEASTNNYFADIAWTDGTTHLIATAGVAGRGFVVTETVEDVEGGTDDATFVVSLEETPNTPKILDFLIKTGAKRVHIVFIATGEKVTTVKLHTNTLRFPGIVQDTYNRKLGAGSPLTTISKYPTRATAFNGVNVPFITTFGLATGIGAGAVISGGHSRDQDEWIMPASESWLITIETTTDDNQANFQINWYEIAE